MPCHRHTPMEQVDDHCNRHHGGLSVVPLVPSTGTPALVNLPPQPLPPRADVWQVADTGNDNQPGTPIVRRARVRRIAKDDVSLHACRHHLRIANLLCKIQKALYHGCTARMSGRPQDVEVSGADEQQAEMLFDRLEGWLHAESTDDSDLKLPVRTWLLCLPAMEQVIELCGFHLRWPRAFQHLRSAASGVLSFVAPGMYIKYKVSRGSRPYISDISLIFTVYQFKPVIMQLSTGTDLQTTDALEMVLEERTKIAVEEWVAAQPGVLRPEWVAWAKTPTVALVTAAGTQQQL